MPKKTNNLTGVAGEHYVCAELARNGYIALLTPKNNPLFDIIVTNQEGTRSVYIQVKTKADDNKQGWKLGKDMEKKHGNLELFVVLVDLKNGQPDFYVYPHDVLSERISSLYCKYLAQPKRDGMPRKDVGFRWFDTRLFTSDDQKRKDDKWKIITDRLMKKEEE